MELLVENIKCGGCANSIKKKLLEVKGVDEVSVDIENGKISVYGLPESDKEKILSLLADMGYTEPGEGDMIDKAKSYVSCMIGRIQS